MSPGNFWSNNLVWASELSRVGLLKHRRLGSQSTSRVSDTRDTVRPENVHCNKFPDVGNKGSLFEDHCFVRYGGIGIHSKLFVRIRLRSNIIRRVGMYVSVDSLCSV